MILGAWLILDHAHWLQIPATPTLQQFVVAIAYKRKREGGIMATGPVSSSLLSDSWTNLAAVEPSTEHTGKVHVHVHVHVLINKQ